jgi:hypothetical protein
MANIGPQMIVPQIQMAQPHEDYSTYLNQLSERDPLTKAMLDAILCKQRVVRASLAKRVDIIAAATRHAGSSLRIRKRATRKSREKHA